MTTSSPYAGMQEAVEVILKLDESFDGTIGALLAR
jgi:hypothetical protein